MRLRERELDPRIRRELNAVDAALRGERVEPEFDDLAAIAAELREARPALDRDSAAELDDWAAKGFPRSDEAPSSGGDASKARRTKRGPGRWLTPAFGTGCAMLLVALVVGISQLQGGADDSAQSGDVGLSGKSAEPATKAPTPAVAESGTVPRDSADLKNASTVRVPSAIPGAFANQNRVKETSAALTLSTNGDQVADVADEVVDVTDRYGGIVDQSSVSTGDAGSPRASFNLRIPSQNLQAALADLSDLAHVKSRDEASLDITKPFVSAEERFDDSRAEVDALLEQLAQADTATEIESIRAQLRIARNELAAVRAQLKDLKQRAGFSVVTVGVVSEGDGPGWSLGEAADDAVNVLEAIGGALLITLAVIVPLGAIAAALWFGTATLRRRRRESVLDG